MASKAQKLRLKRTQAAGRPRKQNVERFPSGKVKPFETEKENKSVALDARKRLHGCNDDNPHAGYVLGRIYLDGKITKEQLEAGDAYAETMARYYRLTGIPAPSPRAQSLFSIRGHDGEVTESLAARARAATNAMMEAQGILLRCIDGPQVKSTIHSVTVMGDDHLRGMPQQQILWLRRGLQALHDRKALAKS